MYSTARELRVNLDRLLADRAYRDALGLHGHEAYRQTWTAEVHLDRYMALIDELSNKREKRSLAMRQGAP